LKINKKKHLKQWEYFICVVIKTNSKIRCDQLKNKSSRRVTYGNPCYSIGSKANSIYFDDRSVEWNLGKEVKITAGSEILHLPQADRWPRL
jgi:hypothetical protein